MSPVDPPEPPPGPIGFERDVFIDKPGIVGARWWHKSLIAQDAAMRRREVLKTIAIVGGVAGGLGLFAFGVEKLAKATSGESVKLETRGSLEMQRKYGWDFGARGEALVFDGKSTAPFNRLALADLPNVMRSATFSQFSVATLLESLTATPADALPAPQDGSTAADAGTFHKLVDVVVPVETPAMQRAYRAGSALARLAAKGANRLALLIDLEATESVAFAAGACELFEPVLLFDNWPHPRGVVPSHMALAAMAYYQPRFALQNKTRSPVRVPPMFLLDRQRLNPYSEDSTRFDNRYYAKPPAASALLSRGFDGLLYVVEAMSSLPEPDDLFMLGDAAPDVTARAIALSDFSPSSAVLPAPEIAPTPLPPGGSSQPTTPLAYYGGWAETDPSIWVNYPFVKDYALPSGAKADSPLKDYRFKHHTLAKMSALPALGATAVVVTASGLLVAAALDRRGSMNRFSGGWGG